MLIFNISDNFLSVMHCRRPRQDCRSRPERPQPFRAHQSSRKTQRYARRFTLSVRFLLQSQLMLTSLTFYRLRYSFDKSFDVIGQIPELFSDPHEQQPATVSQTLFRFRPAQPYNYKQTCRTLARFIQQVRTNIRIAINRSLSKQRAAAINCGF
jgi:hypothetical protein